MKVYLATEQRQYEDLFPAKLHYVLEQTDNDPTDGVNGQGSVISWQPHGKSFMVKDKDAFVKHYLPNWFRQTTWASFQRQLNHYDFKRITSGPDRNAYYHPSFVRGDRSLCKNIRRVKVKGRGPRQPSRPEDQPDFYHLVGGGAAVVDAPGDPTPAWCPSSSTAAATAGDHLPRPTMADGSTPIVRGLLGATAAASATLPTTAGGGPPPPPDLGSRCLEQRVAGPAGQRSSGGGVSIIPPSFVTPSSLLADPVRWQLPCAAANTPPCFALGAPAAGGGPASSTYHDLLRMAVLMVSAANNNEALRVREPQQQQQQQQPFVFWSPSSHGGVEQSS